MPLPPDPAPSLAGYAHPEKLVTTSWLADHLAADGPVAGLAVVESDEDILVYDTGHIPGAIRVDWFTELNDPVLRDYLDGPAFAALMSAKGIARDDTVVIYGDRSNWWAAYALWVFELFGHPDVRLLDGGRAAWEAEGRPLVRDAVDRPRAEYPPVTREDAPIRAFRDDVLGHLGRHPLVDVRSPQEYTGERTHMPDYPDEGALRGGHIPTAVSVPWARAAADDGRYRSREELEQIYLDGAGLSRDDDVIVYCRIGERSSHTWFALRYLLGLPGVRNYDGSWTEWGSSVRVPIARGEEPGTAPAPHHPGGSA